MTERLASKRVLTLFADAEALARQLAALTDEETQLRTALVPVWRRKTTVMPELADKSREASLAEIAECLKRQHRN